MTELPDRIVIEGAEGFEINEPEDIQLVFRVARRLNLTPEQAILYALRRAEENEPDMARQPELSSLSES
jgi:hypothetical protein